MFDNSKRIITLAMVLVLLFVGMTMVKTSKALPPESGKEISHPDQAKVNIIYKYNLMDDTCKVITNYGTLSLGLHKKGTPNWKRDKSDTLFFNGSEQHHFYLGSPILIDKVFRLGYSDVVICLNNIFNDHYDQPRPRTTINIIDVNPRNMWIDIQPYEDFIFIDPFKTVFNQQGSKLYLINVRSTDLYGFRKGPADNKMEAWVYEGGKLQRLKQYPSKDADKMVAIIPQDVIKEEILRSHFVTSSWE